MSSTTDEGEQRRHFIGPQPREQHRGHASTASPANENSTAERDSQPRSRPAPAAALSQFQQGHPDRRHRHRHVTISNRNRAATTSAASKKRPSRAAESLAHRPPPRPSSSIHTLLRDRQRRGRPMFLARPGAAAWSPDPLHRAFAGNAHTLRRLKLSGELRGHGGCVNTVSCTPDGQYWITGSDDMKLMVSVSSLWKPAIVDCL